MERKELDEILQLHKMWLNGEKGKCADLQGADLRGANLRGVDLQDANLRGANLRGVDLQDADLRSANLLDADLRSANLQDANLRDANLRGANLRGVDLDYSCWPLWCGSLDAKVDRRIAAQLAYHFCRLDCDDPDYIAARNAIIHFANEFHLVEECGWLEPKEVKQDE